MLYILRQLFGQHEESSCSLHPMILCRMTEDNRSSRDDSTPYKNQMNMMVSCTNDECHDLVSLSAKGLLVRRWRFFDEMSTVWHLGRVAQASIRFPPVMLPEPVWRT